MLGILREYWHFNKSYLKHKDLILKTDASYGHFRHHGEIAQEGTWAGRPLHTLPNHCPREVILLV